MQAHDLNRRQLLSCSLLPLLGAPLASHASDAWPTKPVKFIVPFPPAGPVDTTARACSVKLGELWNVPTVVDNRPGAGGVVGAAAAAREPADGYSVFVGAIHHSVNHTLQRTFAVKISSYRSDQVHDATATLVMDRRPDDALLRALAWTLFGSMIAGSLLLSLGVVA